MGPTPAVIATIVLLVGNAFFVAAEFALLAARRHRLEQAVATRKRGAASALAGVRELTLMLAGAQLGITMCSLGLGVVSEPAFAAMLDPLFQAVGLPAAAGHAIAFAVALTTIVLLHMVIGEMAPKSWAISDPERAALLLAPPFRAFTRGVRPLLRALNGISNAALRAARIRPKDEVSVPKDAEGLRRLVGESRRLGLIGSDEHDVLTATLRTHTEPLARLVVPADRIDAVPAGAGPEEIVAASRRHGRNRLLVRGADGHLTGVLHVREVLSIRAPHPVAASGTTAGELASPVLTLAVDTPIQRAVAALRERRASIALVRDTDGRLMGMVGLDDLLGSVLGGTRAA
ncbi:hemolysin family protein [Yinghuangia sp. ASG 101]|uniref:hemolysin family protein n=1 Tax=Yinghuangia sp. ASG 101 TaxID=2896848 RepID=UPI001E493832|nr:hemolysin family protein [Yinghuangia sp. ASG 101]UGQ15293.1 hemolysin family protein [Yinghuangia sp. ASG 101]